MTWHRDRLYMTTKLTDDTSGGIYVYDPAAESWSRWTIAARGLCCAEVSSANYGLLFSLNDHVYKITEAYTTDNGSAITGKYRTAFFDPGSPGAEKVIREWLLDGSGSINVKVAYNDGSLGTAAAVTLGTAPAVAQGRDRRAVLGRNFSLELSTNSGAWSVSRIIGHLRDQRGIGARAT